MFCWVRGGAHRWAVAAPPFATPHVSELRGCCRTDQSRHIDEAEVSGVELKSGCPLREAKVITVNLKGTAVKTRPNPRNSSKRSRGVSFAYQIVKYCP